ncbi:MAG: GntR family transcriptional regulator [Eubacteriales bacterium]|nr:GntR family transcriptional regulator [Eubacteriales bacterium]
MDAVKKSHTSTLTEYAYKEIKQLIQNGTFQPGSKLVTQDIANQLGISRTPVVAAVNRLVAEEYADSIPHQGTFVKKLSVKNIRDILELRLMIELYSVDIVIRNMVFDTEAVKELRSAVEEYRNIGPRDYDKAMKVECDFHQTIIGLTENSEILRVYKNSRCIETTYQMYRMANMELSTFQDTYQEHEKIVEMLEAGNRAAVKALLEKHIRLPLNMLEWLVSTGRPIGGLSL